VRASKGGECSGRRSTFTIGKGKRRISVREMGVQQSVVASVMLIDVVNRGKGDGEDVEYVLWNRT